MDSGRLRFGENQTISIRCVAKHSCYIMYLFYVFNHEYVLLWVNTISLFGCLKSSHKDTREHELWAILALRSVLTCVCACVCMHSWMSE